MSEASLSSEAGERQPSLWRKWLWALATTNPPAGRLDPVSKWLVLTRAGVLPMTLVSGATAGLLAAWQGAAVHWGLFALALLGIVLAHVANNLMNDLFDLAVGTDTEDYPRNLYAPHPVLSGMISRTGLLAAAALVNAACLVIMLVLAEARGGAVVAFAVAGFLLSAAYTAPPLRLKKHGLGEPTVLVVWGPLMVAGSYFVATGGHSSGAVLASLPFAILSTTVLMGKHIDKIPWDAPAGTHTLPVLLGEARARTLTRGMFVAFYALVAALVAVGLLPWATLLVAFSLPVARRTWAAFGSPKPEKSPVPNPVWPLWFAPHAFLLTRRAGGLLVLGLVFGALST
jgi:1,4-dihydroxy-2-naphthoate octaprenyltransferase